MSCLDNGRYTVACGATGLIRACLEASVKYARERHTFGKEIGQHQLIQEMIAKMTRDYEMARLLCRAVSAQRQGSLHLRGHQPDSHADAGGIRAGLPGGSAPEVRAAGV